MALILTGMNYRVSGRYLVYYRGLNHFLCTLEVSKLGIFICCRTGAATPTKQIYFLSIDEVSKDYIFFIAVILFYMFSPHSLKGKQKEEGIIVTYVKKILQSYV